MNFLYIVIGGLLFYMATLYFFIISYFSFMAKTLKLKPLKKIGPFSIAIVVTFAYTAISALSFALSMLFRLEVPIVWLCFLILNTVLTILITFFLIKKLYKSDWKNTIILTFAGYLFQLSVILFFIILLVLTRAS